MNSVKHKHSGSKIGSTVVALSVYTFDDDEIYYTFAPELDIIGYGYTPAEANTSFEHMLDEYLNFTAEKGTLIQDLEEHGWEINSEDATFTHPTTAFLSKVNALFAELTKKNNLSVYKKNIEFQIA